MTRFKAVSNEPGNITEHFSITDPAIKAREQVPPFILAFDFDPIVIFFGVLLKQVRVLRLGVKVARVGSIYRSVTVFYEHPCNLGIIFLSP